MSEPVWYYVDATGQRQGPVDTASVAEAVRAGVADDQSLVWREGMAEWQPLAGFRAELGLMPAPPVVTLQPAPPPGPLPPPGSPPGTPGQKSGKGCLVAALVIGGIGAVFLFAILAAIALPAYQDYVLRSQLLGALHEGRAAQLQVDEFVANTDRCPREGAEIGLVPPATSGVRAITVGEAESGMCTIDITLAAERPDTPDGDWLRLSRDSAGDWYCTSNLERRAALPEDCR